MNKEDLGKVRRRKTKIVATLGPASDSEQLIKSLILAGVDCFRLNFSHGTLEEHYARIKKVRRIAREASKTVAIMQDLPGPKVRVGLLKDGILDLKRGDIINIVEEPYYKGSKEEIPVNVEELEKAVKQSDIISLADGTVRLKVLEVKNGFIKSECIQGGKIISGKGVNLTGLNSPAFTKKDEEMLRFGLEMNVDFVAVSFVRNKNDLLVARSKISGDNPPLLIAKIEKREALNDLENIVSEADLVMVARGDLGVENPIEKVPLIQKQIIRVAMQHSRPTITATQILESMVLNPSPTRAEVTDIANAIIDGTDALMLSEETAIGKYPVECVEVLNKVAAETESKIGKLARFEFTPTEPRDSLGEAAVRISQEISSQLIVSLSDSFEFVSNLARYRPKASIIVPTSSEQRMRRLNMVWGVIPFYFRGFKKKADDIATEVSARYRIARGKLGVAVGKENMGEGGLFIFKIRD